MENTIEFRGQGYSKSELPPKYRYGIVAGEYEGGKETLEAFIIPEVGDETSFGTVVDVKYVEGDPANPGILTVVFNTDRL